MPQNNNSEITKNLRDGLKINQAVDLVPTDIGKTIVPVFLCNTLIPPGSINIGANTASDSVTETIFTTHATKRTFAIGAGISVAKSALSDSLISTISLIPLNKANTQVLFIRYEPTTAGNFTENINFSEPIELEKNSAVRVTNSTATASIDTTGSVFYFEIDP